MLSKKILFNQILIVFWGYPVAFVASFYGYEKVLMLAVFWSAIAGSTIVNKYYKGSIKLLIITSYLAVCFSLNFIFSAFSNVNPKSAIGFTFFWLIIQGVMFVSLIAMYSFSMFVSSKKRRH